MRRYKPPMLFSTQKPAHMHDDLGGDYVLHSEALAEIDRLEKEVERLTDELTASCAREEIQQREAERLRRDNGVLHDAIEKIFEEGAKQLARADTAWNDAIEAAASLADKGIEDGGMARSMAFFLNADDWVNYRRDIQGYASSIRALKRSQE